MSEPTGDEIARWAELAAFLAMEPRRAISIEEHIEIIRSYPRLLALVAAQAGQIAGLRAGEADADPEEGIIPTPAQWLRKYNRATPEKRLDAAANVMEDGRTAMRCWEEDHPAAIAMWRDRAERAEAKIADLEAAVEHWERLVVVVGGQAGEYVTVIARVRALIEGMHEDWCRGKGDPARECECIRADVLAALDGTEATDQSAWKHNVVAVTPEMGRFIEEAAEWDGPPVFAALDDGTEATP